MGWNMHHLLAYGEDWPDGIIVHKPNERNNARRYVPETSLEGDSSLRKAVEGLEGQLSVLQDENEALRAELGQS